MVYEFRKQQQNMEDEFVYTVNNSALSEGERRFYEENGYIVIKKLLPSENLDKCYKRFMEVCNGNTTNVNAILRVSNLKARPGLKTEFTINKIQDFMHDPVFFQNYISHEQIIKFVGSIIGPNITAINTMVINKPPGISYALSSHPLHQDQHYFPFRPSNRAVASWTAMEEVNEENGCLFVIPGSHRANKLYQHVYPKNVNKQCYHGVQGFDDSPRVNLLMERGDTVFFHPLLLHGSGPNISAGFRKAISVHYADSDSYFINLKGKLQEDLEREIIMGAKKQGFHYLNLTHFFKSRSRIIAGRPGNFQNICSHL